MTGVRRRLDGWRAESGSTTVEFVATFAFAVILFLGVIELALAWFCWIGAEKAAQIGVRRAVVSDPVVNGLPPTNQRAAGALFGAPCQDESAPCRSFAPLLCAGGTGGQCATDPAGFTALVTLMRRHFGPIEARHVSVRYQYTGLGYAGGPTVPLVTLTVAGVPFRTGVVSVLGNLIGDGGPLVTIPTIAVSMTGEDMSSRGSP